MADPLYVATKTAHIQTPDNGGSWVVIKGKTEVRSGHPVYKVAPELFKRVGPISGRRSKAEPDTGSMYDAANAEA